ncbi:hypothetical protein G6F32_015950 [Rhizopus arrhizus]|nr:hypothetical protein G6F32_015950 [Rhizopus arrhizus]
MAGEKHGSVPIRCGGRGCSRIVGAFRHGLAVFGGLAGRRGLRGLVLRLAGVGFQGDLHLRRRADDAAVTRARALVLGVGHGAFNRGIVIAFGFLLGAPCSTQCRTGQQQPHDAEFAGSGNDVDAGGHGSLSVN